MKKITLLLVMLLAVVGVNATETTLWEDTYQSGVELNAETVATFKEGDILRVYATVPEGGANFKIVYKSSVDNWAEHTIPSIGEWHWVNGGETYKDLALTANDITTLSGKNIYIYKGEHSTITKVSLITPVIWEGTQATGDWSNNVDLSYGNKGKLSEIFMNDKIRITYKDAGEGATVRVANPNGWGEYEAASQAEATPGDNQTFEYTITSAVILEKIQQNGILGRGKNITITKIELLKGDGRYDAVPLTIGADGIATYGSTKNLDFSGISEVTPYYVSEVNTGSVTLTSVEKTRAWAGYIVQGTPGTYSVPVNATEPGWIDAFNNLRYSGDYDGNWVYRSVYSDYSAGGDNEEKIKTYHRYIFAKNNSGEIGFYKLAEDYSREITVNEIVTTVYYHELGAHKAYLETEEDVTPEGEGNARVALIFDDGETTGVKEVKGLKAETRGEYYDLMGRKVAQPTRGLYIVNGKKVVIK